MNVMNDLMNETKTLNRTGSYADRNRRTDIINTCESPDDLTEKLQTFGYIFNRSSAYLKLLPRTKPRTKYSSEGQHQKKVANLKLCRAQPMQRAQNNSRWFVNTTMKCVEGFAVLKGTDNVTILSHFLGHSCSQRADPHSNPYGVLCYSTGSHV